MAVWSEVNFSALTDDLRIDAEHYRPEYLTLERRIASLPHTPLSSIANISDGNHVSIAEQFTECGIRYLRGQDLSDFFISDSDPIFIPETTYKMLHRSHMRVGDVLLGIVATVGTVGLVTDRFGKLTGNCKIAIIRPKSVEGEFLAAFFLSKLGQMEIHRWVRGTVQTGLILPDLKNLAIPLISEDIRLCVTELVKAANKKKQEAERDYIAAESALKSALGLDRVDLAPRLFYEDRFSHATEAGRLDAEYFSPRMQNVIETLSRDGLTIADVAPQKKRHFKPIPGQPFKYIEIADIGGSGIAESKTIAGEEAPSRATWIVKAGDIITTTVRPIRRLSVIIAPEQEGYVCSSGFAVLRPREIEPELLLTYLRLPIVAELLDLHTTASMYPAISTTELLRIPISLPKEVDRREIVAKVRESFAAVKESRRLLDTAKRAVEIAIEEGEAAAREFLNSP